MNQQHKVRVSKFLSRILRHAPEELGLTLETGGWVLIHDLLHACSVAGMNITTAELDEVVQTCQKQRFAFDEGHTKIRANQGHSAEVDLQLEQAKPLGGLFHGTATRNLESILRDGLSKMTRHHVHLSEDVSTALKVGGRHGKPVVLEVDASRMVADGHVFFLSANGVWLVDTVPPHYLRVMTLEN
ncbi:MAG: RNA 2'-phosphotransferase [Planctomycetaceae bacterium]|nr:RNA 2'-phosphotransferase [Planctomycetaceae bacterium]